MKKKVIRSRKFLDLYNFSPNGKIKLREMVERGVGDTQSGETLNDKQVLDMLMSKY